MLRTEPEIQQKYEEWAASRGQFLNSLRDNNPEAVKQGWQKHYTLASVEKKARVHEFRLMPPVAETPDSSPGLQTNSNPPTSGHDTPSSGEQSSVRRTE